MGTIIQMNYAAKYGRAAVAGVIDRFAEGEREEQRSREEREAEAKTDARAVRRTLVEQGEVPPEGQGCPCGKPCFRFFSKKGCNKGEKCKWCHHESHRGRKRC